MRRPRTPTAAPRFALLALGMVALVVGVAAGLVRMGWVLPMSLAQQAAWHGPLMLSGLFVVVIGLERAVAIGRSWAYLAPLAAGLGTAGVVLGAPGVGLLGYTVGSAVLVLATAEAARRQREPFMAVLGLGAACAVGGNAAWAMGAPMSAGLLPLWAFLVLTIAGERLELSRYVPRPRHASTVFWLLLGALLAALALPEGWDARLFGAALLGLVAWLLCFDLARRTVRQPGLTRFVAVALLAGYAQLAVAGALMVVFGLQPGLPSYDAALHALGLGFVFSMVFGHAPLIGPALLRVRLPFSPVLYLPLAMLHGSVVARWLALALGHEGARRWAGAGSAAAIGLFLLSLVALGLRASRAAPASGARRRRA